MSKQVLIMPLPPGTLGSYSLAAVSGAIAATPAANDQYFSFRWGNAVNYAAIEMVYVSVATSAAITTAVPFGLDMVIARAFTASASGGTALTLTTNNAKLKTDFSTTLVTDMRIATTGALTAGTQTLDAQPMAQVVFGTGTAVGSTILTQSVLFDRAVNDYPLVLAQNEGFVIAASMTGHATGSLRVGVNVKWLEVSKQVF